MSKRISIYAVVYAVLVIMIGCANMPGVYQIDMRQGNYIDQTLVDQLGPGMSKRQVQSLLGTPLINDPFHADRWDYVYRFESDGKLRKNRRLSLFFEGELLARIETGPNLQ